MRHLKPVISLNYFTFNSSNITLMREQPWTKVTHFWNIILNTKLKVIKFRENFAKILRTRKNFMYMKLPPQIYQKFTSWKTQRKNVNQTTAIQIAIEYNHYLSPKKLCWDTIWNSSYCHLNLAYLLLPKLQE